MAKYGPAGWTAQGGVTAAVLASMGYQGDRSVLDGKSGFPAMVGSQQFNADKIVDTLGAEWNILRVMYKRWPSAGNFQAPLGALSKLIEEHRLRPEEIEAIHVENEAFAMLPRFQFDQLRHNVDTQTNLAYLLAVAAHRVKISSAWQSQETRNNPSVRELMQKVTIAAYPRAEEIRHQELVVEGREYIERRPCRVRIWARDTQLTQSAEYAYWLASENEEYRASDEDLAQKFRANAEEALPPAKLDTAIDKIMHIEELPNVDALFHELIPAGD